MAHSVACDGVWGWLSPAHNLRAEYHSSPAETGLPISGCEVRSAYCYSERRVSLRSKPGHLNPGQEAWEWVRREFSHRGLEQAWSPAEDHSVDDGALTREPPGPSTQLWLSSLIRPWVPWHLGLDTSYSSSFSDTFH